MARSNKNISTATLPEADYGGGAAPEDAEHSDLAVEAESAATMASAEKNILASVDKASEAEDEDDDNDAPHKSQEEDSSSDKGYHHHQSASVPLNSSSSSASTTSSSAAATRNDKRKRSSEDPRGEDADGGSTDSPIPPPWQPQNVQSTIEFTHIIDEYASKRDSGCKKAEYSAVAVDDHGNRWRLIVYVNGNGRASNHHLSLFLQVADADDLPFGWKKAVSYVLTLEHPGGTTLSYSKRNPDKTFKLCPKAIDWGWSQFITSDRIQQEGFVSNDTLTVRAQVTVKSSSVNIDEEDSELYLKCAVEEGDVDAVQTCLDNGASVNCQFKDDLYTPLHTACSSGTTTGSIDVLQLLLEEGADPNASNKWKETPLLIAANNGHRLGVAALLKHGADPSLCSEAGWSALTFAAHKGYDDIVALLLRAGAPVNSRVTEDLSTPLQKACAGSKPGHTASVKLLLEAEADVHALNKWRETPLLTAANHGQATAVEALLAHGADPCKCTDTGWSPLSIAAYKGHDEVVRMLLEEGAPTEEDDPTLSALLQAATKGLPDTVDLLLRHGADHTVTTKKGDTALSILVEQNLIDAAVDMVTEYNASIPRCSRDRKKVQRARLLINHRMKQQERLGKNTGSEDEESHAEPDENIEAQHSPTNEQESSGAKAGKKKKKGKKKGMSAEEKAKAAEEALLLELEQEEAEAKKEEAEASKKQAKKKKKKERERQQKLKEEQERKEREENEKRERERIRREQEERQRKEREERERKLREQREAEMKKMQEKAMAAKKKEKEQKERERKERESQQRRREDKTKREHANPASPSGSSTSTTEARGKNLNAKKPGNVASAPSTPVTAPPIQAAKKNVVTPVVQGSNRRWESRAKITPQPFAEPVTAKQTLPLPSVQQRNGIQRATSNSSAGSSFRQSPASTNSVNISAQSSKASTNNTLTGAVQVVNALSGVDTPIEHPTIALHRKEKVSELLRNASSAVNVVDHLTVKRAMWRWIVRAAHSGNKSLDPLIPNDANVMELTGFFQRQFISEVRRRSTQGFPIHMEQLKEAGSVVANMCQSAAKEMSEFRNTINGQLSSSNWDDSQAGMGYNVQNGTSDVVRVSWANRAEVFMPVDTLTNLRDRFTGNQSRFLAAIFAAKLWDETKHLIVDNTDLDMWLPRSTQNCLSADASVSAELHADPFTVARGNAFWSSFECIDTLFGGRPAFGSNATFADALLRQGGSVSGILPADSFVSQQYLREILNTLDKATVKRVPVSFAVFVTDESLPDPCGTDFGLVDPRLRDNSSGYVQRKEFLLAGHHVFVSGEGVAKAATKDTVFLILQNELGRTQFALTDAVVRSVVQSMSVASTQPLSPAVAFRSGFNVPRESPLSSPTPYFDNMMAARPLDQPSPGTQLFMPSDFGTIGGTSSTTPFSPAGENVSRSTRRGRLFDLVDDVEEDNSNDVDLVSGMLNNLDVGLFQSNSANSDIDIEAISLMGIGGNSLSLPPRNSGAGTFG